MRQLPTKRATTAIKSYTDRKTHTQSTAYMKGFRRMLYGSTWMEKHFCSSLFQFSAVHLCWNSKLHCFFWEHKHTYTYTTYKHIYTFYLNPTCAVCINTTITSQIDRWWLCAIIVFFTLLCWSKRCSIALAALPLTSTWKVSIHMRCGSTSIKTKKDSQSTREREKKVWSICFMSKVYTCSTLQILK